MGDMLKFLRGRPQPYPDVFQDSQPLTEPIVAWRMWETNLRNQLLPLFGVNWDVAWPKGSPCEAIFHAGKFASSAEHSLRRKCIPHHIHQHDPRDVGYCRHCHELIFPLVDEYAKRYTGIYGFKKAPLHDPPGAGLSAADKFAIVLYQQDSVTSVFGEVYLWGKVTEHEHGYRAQYAYPKHLYSYNTTALRIAREYGCDGSTINDTEEAFRIVGVSKHFDPAWYI